MNATILIVEDEEDLCTLLRYNFEDKGFKVIVANDGDEAIALVKENPPDLIMLDWMLPNISGIELCKLWRKNPKTANIPIIMMTARGEENDKIRGLATGADDYIVKPFSILETLARVDALLRRTKPTLVNPILKGANIELDRTSHRVKKAGEEIHLGPKEYRLLEYFLMNIGKVLSREKLLNNVWGNDVYVDDRTVDVHIARLRKLITNKGQKSPIRTIRAEGYAFDESF